MKVRCIDNYLITRDNKDYWGSDLERGEIYEADDEIVTVKGEQCYILKELGARLAERFEIVGKPNSLITTDSF